MIKLVDSTRVFGDGEPTLKLFADTQDEVEGGEIVGWSGQVPAGSTIYTADGGNGIFKSDGTVAWQGGGGGVNSFTITSHDEPYEYNFDSGMTWEDFIRSDYNSDGLFYGEALLHFDGGDVYLGENEVYIEDTIVNGGEYRALF